MSDLKIALIHATTLAMSPVHSAFQRLWPQAQLMNLLDDSLSPALADAGCITASLIDRFGQLAAYAKGAGASGILFTCSAFGPAIEAASARVGIPALKPNEAMFAQALQCCVALGRAGRIGMVSTFAASVPSMREELLYMAQASGLSIELHVDCPGGALAALAAGHAEVHDAAVSASAARLADMDVILLGQFSTAHMRERVHAQTGRPVFSSPDSAVQQLKQLVEALPLA